MTRFDVATERRADGLRVMTIIGDPATLQALGEVMKGLRDHLNSDVPAEDNVGYIFTRMAELGRGDVSGNGS